MSANEIIASIQDQLDVLKASIAQTSNNQTSPQDEIRQLRHENTKLRKELRQSERQIKALLITLNAQKSRYGAVIGAGSSQAEIQSSIDVATEETRLESEQHEEHMTGVISSSPPIKLEVGLESSQAADPLLATLLSRTWHPNDFIVNPDANEGLDFAFQEKVLGKKRSALPSIECRDCKAFTKSTGIKCTRHREKWGKQSTPPGFWRSDFDSLLDRQDKEEALAKAEEESKCRLNEALCNGRYIFRDPALRKKAKLGLFR